MILILIGALIGALAGGFGGMLVGVAVVLVLRWGLARLFRRGLHMVQRQFLDSTFAVMGALCKVDGVVSRDEIRTVENLFDRLHLSAQQREAAKTAFQRGKDADFDLDGEISRLARVCRGRGPLLNMFLQLQLTAIAANGRVDPAQHEMLLRVARGLGLPEAELERLEAGLRAAAGGQAGGGGVSREKRIEDAYAALGVSPSATDAQVKQAYRRLISENHPDKLTARGMPESMREVAEERTRELTTAYDLIKEERGMV